MSESTKAGQSMEDESLKTVFDQGMKLFDEIEKGNEPTNSDPVQMSVKAAISKFEKATRLVSLSDMFSANESLEELPTETLQYLLLPALLGTLSLKLCGQPRKEVIHLSEIYFRDFLHRCKDYGVTNIEVPEPNADSPPIERVFTEQAKIANMMSTREAKIKRYKEAKELKEKLSTLAAAMESSRVDDETKREYFTTMLLDYVNQALDELASIQQEKPLLEYMEKHGGEPRPRYKREPLRPVIITRDALQKAVYGAGYPSLPTMSVEEFYDQRVRDGTFPSATNIAHTMIQNTEADEDDDERATKELLEEADDPDERARRCAMDEYKDEHRRGWGNRHNRS